MFCISLNNEEYIICICVFMLMLFYKCLGIIFELKFLIFRSLGKHEYFFFFKIKLEWKRISLKCSYFIFFNLKKHLWYLIFSIAFYYYYLTLVSFSLSTRKLKLSKLLKKEENFPWNKDWSNILLAKKVQLIMLQLVISFLKR